MSRVYCPNCDRPLFGAALDCFHCGWSAPTTDPMFHEGDTRSATTEESEAITPEGSYGHTTIGARPMAVPHSDSAWSGYQIEETPLQLTWQKVVETPHRPLATYPPRPRRPLQSHAVLRYIPYGWPVRPAVFFWVCMGLVVLIAGAGTIGLAANHVSLSSPADPMLSVSPRIAAAGTMMSLQGSGFTPDSQVGLSRDSSIPLLNSENSSLTSADEQGNLRDTSQVGSDWGSGPHTINAEDAQTHKTTSFPILVTGDVGPLQPAHLHLSATSVDLGTGDQATNSMQPLTLQNDGGGQIQWTAMATQPWLMLSPRSGVLSDNIASRIVIAGNRYNLTPGDYTAQILFSSNAGDGVLNVHMRVTPLIISNAAVLQLTPAVLAFTAVDGGSAPDPQVVTVSNPGSLALRWTAHSSVPWLALSKQRSMVAPGQSNTVQVTPRTSTLLPGTYSGQLTFTATGSVMHSPQTVYVSITITPHCSLQATPDVLSFAGSVGQSSGQSKTIALSTSSSCSSPLRWSAQSTSSWLTTSSSSGKTPVSLSIQVHSAGLAAGTYNGSINFTTSTGTLVVLVNLTLGNSSVPALSVNVGALNFQGSSGDTTSSVQALQLTNVGGGALFWQANAATELGRNWLSMNTTSGELGVGQSVLLDVRVSPADLAADTYTGMIIFSMHDAAEHTLAGAPVLIPVNLVVSQPCTLQVSPDALTFLGYTNQSAPAAQSASLVATSACKHPLLWSASATSLAGEPWLSTSITGGTLSVGQTGTLPVNVRLDGLSQGIYRGTINISAIDSVTRKAVGSVQTVAVTLNVQPPCTLLLPASPNLSFSSEIGGGAQTRTFQVSVVGSCKHVVNVVSTATNASGNWLTVTPSSIAVASGHQATITVVATPGSLGANLYNGSINLVALDGGMVIVGSPQSFNASLLLASLPVLAVSQSGGLTFNVSSNGQVAQTITISNTGGGTLSWNASLDASAPAFITLSGQSGTVAAGLSAPLLVEVDPSSATAGTYTSRVMINATNAATGAPINTVSIPLTIIIVAPPQMQLSTNNFTFEATTSSNPAGQVLSISNTGGGTLLWSISTPTASWLSASQYSGSLNVGQSSPIMLNVDTTGLLTSAAMYSASVVLTPSIGAPVTINVGLIVDDLPGSPTTAGSPTSVSPVPIIETSTVVSTP